MRARDGSRYMRAARRLDLTTSSLSNWTGRDAQTDRQVAVVIGFQADDWTENPSQCDFRRYTFPISALLPLSIDMSLCASAYVSVAVVLPSTAAEADFHQ